MLFVFRSTPSSRVYAYSPNITSQNLGNAFSVLSGNEYVIDKEKLRKHLEFGEIVRNIPQDYIDNHPYLTAFKLLSRYSDIMLT